jgi:hypothetical protein
MKMLIFLVLLIPLVHAQSSKEVNYEYRKYEKFDLGSMEIQGDLVAPGDVSVREKERETFSLDLFIRRHSDDLAKHDAATIR